VVGSAVEADFQCQTIGTLLEHHEFEPAVATLVVIAIDRLGGLQRGLVIGSKCLTEEI